MRPRSRIQTTGPNNGHQLRDYSKSSNRSESPDLIIANCTPLLGAFFLPVLSGNNGIASHSIDNNAFWNMLRYLKPGTYHVVDGNLVQE